MTTPNEVKALCELERIYLAPLCCTDPNEGRLWCEHDVWPLDDCDENACGVPYVRADIVAAKDALIESLSARNAEMVEALKPFTGRLDTLEENCRKLKCGVPGETNVLTKWLRKARAALGKDASDVRSPGSSEGE